MPAKPKDLKKKKKYGIFVRHLILALCAVIFFIFLVNIMLNLFTRHNVHKQVPDFASLNISDARKAAKKASLRIEVNDSLYVPSLPGGIVLTQLPEAGTEVKSGRRIFVTVNSYKQKMVRVPYVTGYSLRQAKNNIEVAGLEIEKLIYKTDIATNYVLETRYNDRLITPMSNVEAEQGSGVTLIVGMSEDEGTVTVPKIVGFPVNEAKSRLWESGLNVGNEISDDEINILNRHESRIYSQTPEQGTRVRLGTPVSIKMGLDPKKIEEGSTASDRAAKQIINNQNTTQ